MIEKEILENVLRDRGLKVTPKRLELLTLIANYGSAMPNSKIQKNVKNFDRVTLYRTINALLEGGIIHKAHTSNNDVYYAMCKHHCSSGKHNHKHIHFKCTNCLEVSCIQLQEPLYVKIPNVRVQEVEIEAKGVCGKCENI